MKKIIILFCILFSFFNISTFAANEEVNPCHYDEDELNVINELSECLSGSKVVNVGNASLEDADFKETIGTWVNNIAVILTILAVGAIVYGGLLMTLSTGEDEKIKKGKDVIKWGILGFIGVISASAIITLVVNLMYSV